MGISRVIECCWFMVVLLSNVTTVNSGGRSGTLPSWQNTTCLALSMHRNSHQPLCSSVRSLPQPEQSCHEKAAQPHERLQASPGSYQWSHVLPVGRLLVPLDREPLPVLFPQERHW